MDAARPDGYRILREADLRDYLAQLPAIAEVLGGSSRWSFLGNWHFAPRIDPNL
jgi:hypothetical protein